MEFGLKLVYARTSGFGEQDPLPAGYSTVCRCHSFFFLFLVFVDFFKDLVF